ncbi:hypothetical protein GUJ93_ZPchr0002g24252 [Zizania palustris]|uniref:Protein transport protein SEC23 n=1 Tax=Zizania palustris TaxID=103762 RepID=A0A8J5RT61_ZIZPA|nr:hypothetical protein GUJ93_ZPchr0002g24252 [Zizania palustris]
MFQIWQSQFVQVVNNSPYETAYFRMMLDRANAVVMIQPSLISFSFQSGPEPVLLDVTAIATDKILLLDSYFTVVIFHGITIAQWRNAAPHEEADTIIRERFPVPRLVVCDQYGSQARFLLAKLNPSITYNSDNPSPGGDVIFTDDVSFQPTTWWCWSRRRTSASTRATRSIASTSHLSCLLASTRPPPSPPRTVILDADTGVSVRLFLPKLQEPSKKLLVVVFFHGGVFFIESDGSVTYHNYVNSLDAAVGVLVVSVDYREN